MFRNITMHAWLTPLYTDLHFGFCRFRKMQRTDSASICSTKITVAHAISFQSRIVVQNDVEKLSAQSEPIEIPKAVDATITPKYNASDEL